MVSRHTAFDSTSKMVPINGANDRRTLTSHLRSSTSFACSKNSMRVVSNRSKMDLLLLSSLPTPQHAASRRYNSSSTTHRAVSRSIVSSSTRTSICGTRPHASLKAARSLSRTSFCGNESKSTTGGFIVKDQLLCILVHKNFHINITINNSKTRLVSHSARH